MGGEDDMTIKSCGAACFGAALFLLLPTPSQAQQHAVTVTNDVGHLIGCRIRRAGSAVADDVTLRAGQVWTQSYSGSKERMIRCDGSYSNWQALAVDRPYRLVQAGDERILALPR
jgi:hypothetical protein